MGLESSGEVRQREFLFKSPYEQRSGVAGMKVTVAVSDP